jgi:acetate kinase
VNVLVLNAGSSSLKFRLLRMRSDESVLASGLVEKWGTPQASLRMEARGRPAESRSVAAETPADAAEHAMEACRPLGVDAVGYRVVHGGLRFSEPVRIDDRVIDDIRAVSQLAPLHNNLALAAMEAGRKVLPDKPGVAVFDTAFHRTMPDVAALYAIPPEMAQKHGLRRYGFHGISHRYVSQKLLQCLNRPAIGSRLITCHLGNGASLCAIRDGMSIDTSMGLTPLEGLMMGTRSGDIDPGLVLYLMTSAGMSTGEVDELLNRHSGLAGVSGLGSDLRDIEQAARDGNARAELAMEMFAYRVRKYIGAYAAALGSVDAIAFAGGIGEHSPAMRARICATLGAAGLSLDASSNATANADRETSIGVAGARVQVWVIPTNEELQIAREVCDLLLV